MTYNGKSVAEQNSVDLAWDLLMEPSYVDFRNALCSDHSDMKRFRQLVVNSVMATDIMDQDLKKLRDGRWTQAFSESARITDSNPRDNVNRKATIVIEHLIQVSDIAHTMQHWHIYRKWNERLFHEMLTAYRQGRSEKDPSDFWYQGEIGFFDFYIIPLVKKLKDCGVFGVSSDEYLNYAQKNRQEWELRGQEVVATMVEKYKEVESTFVLVGMGNIQDAEKTRVRSRMGCGDSTSVESELMDMIEDAEAQIEDGEAAYESPQNELSFSGTKDGVEVPISDNKLDPEPVASLNDPSKRLEV